MMGYMNTPVSVSSCVIDELIRATGFDQVTEPTYGIEYKCRWLLERIQIMKRDSCNSGIVQDNPEIKALVALTNHERATTEAYSHTIQTQRQQIEDLRQVIDDLKRGIMPERYKPICVCPHCKTPFKDQE